MLYSLIALLLICILLILFVTRPKLNATAPESKVPSDLTLIELDQWLKKIESETTGIKHGAEALIEFSDPENPSVTDHCFLYIHGFSASRQEISPVTSRIADHFDANVFHVRLAGHGVGSEGMISSAETWLQSLADAWKISNYLGNRVVIVGTSTGAPLTLWLLNQAEVANKVAAILLISPNFKLKSPFGFLLTWPLSPSWVHLLLGRTHSWEAESPAHGKVWTTSYSTLAIIEMQKVVDWVASIDLKSISIPMAMMCMENDPTVSSDAASKAFKLWGSAVKSHIPITRNADSIEHVFVGDLAGPERTDETVEMLTQFLEPILR
ncbi:MAG: esterase/lipase [Candidatus Azotimanducaceae bacterium]